MHAMDESMWEFVSLHLRDPAGRINRPGSLIRIGSICLSFFRLMLKAGYPAEEAEALIAQACVAFEGPLSPVIAPEGCFIADYFQAKGSAPLCESAFCNRCPRKLEGCEALERMRFVGEEELTEAA